MTGEPLIMRTTPLLLTEDRLKLPNTCSVCHERKSKLLEEAQLADQDTFTWAEVGTYNAIIGPNEYYSPANSDFNSSHKTFKRMMPTFAWEVLEVYSGPPRVAFRWRHWGTMKNDYVGFNE